jgi:hypothetical protein
MTLGKRMPLLINDRRPLIKTNHAMRVLMKARRTRSRDEDIETIVKAE